MDVAGSRVSILQGKLSFETKPACVSGFLSCVFYNLIITRLNYVCKSLQQFAIINIILYKIILEGVFW